MSSVFEYESYIPYLNDWLANLPNSGRGVKGKIAAHLRVSSSLVSFFFKGSKLLTPEQASILSDFIGHTELEADYFYLLVEFERAGNQRLKQNLQRLLQKTKAEALEVKSRVKKDRELNAEEKSVYYSSWIYTGVRNLSAIDSFKDTKTIAEHLTLPFETVNEVLSYLLKIGMVEQDEQGLKAGPTYTHIDQESPHVNKHRQNWRLRGFQKMEQKRPDNLFYSSPMSLSEKDSERVRLMLLDMISKSVEIMRPSESQVGRCLNIDWFEY
ncbi:MAG: TIGR02147 family protein [Bdellovibrionales bacterium]|nr:TIGR02147 family protein [Bdellovibrionales bacterium]